MRTPVSLAIGAALLLAATACDSNSSSNSSAPSVVKNSSSGSPSGQGSTSSAGQPTNNGSSTSSSSSSSSTSSKSSLSESEAKSSLAQAANNAPSSVVAVNGGYEGATSSGTTMTFWRTDDNGKWVKDGEASSIEAFSPQAGTTIDGKLLPGSSHAVFILHRDIGGTGSSPSAQAFAKTSSGWGAIAADGDSALKVTNETRDIDNMVGAWKDAKFNGDLLMLGTFETQSSNANGYISWQGWQVSGDSFTRVGEAQKPAAASSDYTARATWSMFISPSGKNVCEMYDQRVTCAVPNGNPDVPEHVSAVQLDGSGTTLLPGDMGSPESPDDGAEWAQTGDSVPPRVNGAYSLPYGSSISDGINKCTSTTNGFTCSNDVASFTVNTQSLQRTGPRAN